jgi:hypothetical protein
MGNSWSLGWECPTPCPSCPYFGNVQSRLIGTKYCAIFIPPPYLSVYIGNNEMWALAKGCFQTIALWPLRRTSDKIDTRYSFYTKTVVGSLTYYSHQEEQVFWEQKLNLKQTAQDFFAWNHKWKRTWKVQSFTGGHWVDPGWTSTYFSTFTFLSDAPSRLCLTLVL